MFNVPNLFTAGNFLCGILSLIFAFSGRLDWACFLLFVAMIFDFFDGFLARKMGANPEFGKQLDSLADLVSFGVAPGILMFLTIEFKMEGNMSAVYFKYHYLNFKSFNDFLALSALSIPFFSIFRLAKFNIDTRQTNRFLGVPTPLNTLFFMFFPLLYTAQAASPFSVSETESSLSPLLGVGLMAWTSLLFPILMVTNIPLLALKFKNYKLEENLIRYLMLVLSMIAIFTLQIYALPIIVILYLILSLIDNFSTKTHEI